jgi:hypothetical protein
MVIWAKKHPIWLAAILVAVVAASIAGAGALRSGVLASGTKGGETPVAPTAVPPTEVPISKGGVPVQPTAVPVTPAPVCPIDTQEAQKVLGVNVQKIGTEFCAWVFRCVGPDCPRCVTIPQGWTGTVTTAGRKIMVFDGNGQRVCAIAGTFRFKAGYPADDAVHDINALLAKEQEFGRGENPSFEVELGPSVFDDCAVCEPGQVMAAPGAVTQPQPQGRACPCPVFAGVQTRPLPDGGCKFGPVEPGVTAQVPQGFKAIYWDGKQTLNAGPGETIFTNEASFYCIDP